MPQGFLLHSRPYRETSLIATFMTDTDGRIDLMVRSARGKRARKNQPLLPFCLYDLSWVGKSELKHLQFFETIDRAIELAGDSLFCGFYLNELLYRLLPQQEPEIQLLHIYARALQELSGTTDIEPVLRNFELALLDALGYGIDLASDEFGAGLEAECRYYFVPERGLSKEYTAESSPEIKGSGETFFTISQRDFSSIAVRQLAKNVLRSALAVYLGKRPLRSRELFIK
jgi:DNA repair protein RecO (recombination protein O)